MKAMKKLLAVLLTFTLVMSIAACGSSNEPPQQPAQSNAVEKEPEVKQGSEVEQEAEAEQEPESTPEENVAEEEPSASGYSTEELEEIFTEAYMGLTDSGEGIYYAGSADGEIGLLMFLDPDSAEHYLFVGPVVDNGNGTATITDEEDGITLTFGVEAIEDGIVIDMGEEMGSATLGEVTVKEVIDLIIQIENETTAIVPGQNSSGDADSEGNYEDMSYLYDVITEAYMGAFEDEMTVYIANNDDGSFMIVALLSPDMTESISFVGSATATDNYVTVTDEESGNTLTFAVSTQEDGTMLLDMGDLGEAVVAAVEISEIIEALEAISMETEEIR